MTYLVALLVLLLPVVAQAELQSITHTVQQPFAGSQSPDDARIAAITKAKREALERAGTYIESTTVVKNAQLDSDEILAITAGVAKAEILSQRNYTEDDDFWIEVKVKVTVDTAVLDKSLGKMLEDRNHLKELKASKEREKELLGKIVELQKKIGKSKKSGLEKELSVNTKALLGVDFYEKALQLFNDDTCSDNKLAIDYLTKAITYDPQNYQAYNLRGIINNNQESYNKAIIDFNTALKLNPNYEFAYNNRGVSYSRERNHNKAISDFTKAITIDTKYSDAYMHRAMQYADMKKYNQAFSDITEAIRYNNGNYKAYYNRGLIYLELDNLENAYQDYTKAIEINPDYGPAYNNRGTIEFITKQYDKAVDDFSTAIKISENDAGAFFNLGKAYGELEQFERSISSYTRAIALNYNTADVFNNRGWMYMSLGNYELALPDLSMAIKINPKFTAAYMNRGVTLIKLNQIKKGCSDFNAACKLGNCKSIKVARSNNLCL